MLLRGDSRFGLCRRAKSLTSTEACWRSATDFRPWCKAISHGRFRGAWWIHLGKRVRSTYRRGFTSSLFDLLSRVSFTYKAKPKWWGYAGEWARGQSLTLALWGPQRVR